ncbi:MAG: cytochrome c-type biogenesis protein CcmH [Pseudomonadota bacterium]|nr:cytochrome c-type biogenesis protein CcmH [Pseudomonadota bacterium]
MKTLLLVVATFIATLAFAYDRSADIQPQDMFLFEEISKQLRCPTCQGLSAWESETKFANQIKDIVKEKINAGMTRDEIMEFFTTRYGLWIMRVPPSQGVIGLAWWLPLTLICLCLPLLWYFFWRRKRMLGSDGVRSREVLMKQMQAELEVLRRQ